MSSHQVTFLAVDDAQSLDVAGPWEVFASANRVLDHLGRPGDHYALTLVGPGREITTHSGLRLAVAPLDEAAVPDTLVVPGGEGTRAAVADDALVAWVGRMARSADRVVGVCTGSFLLAAAGVLDGRRATTHWAHAHTLATMHPSLHVEADALYLRDEHVWTSAGVTAGIDVALAVVESDHGSDVAQAVARALVVFLHRPGGQSQFAAPAWTAPVAHDGLRAVRDHVRSHPDADCSVTALAARAGLSPRHFQRRFTEEVGETPARYVERVRVEAARHLLERSDLGMVAIARRAGFGSAETLRRAFLRRVGVAPDHYRSRFALTS